ncbi:hypothetical protein KUTeg_014675 [Tegillarca granosa]|uniref:Peroxidase n=1 Tax=Tegillarca granosa TaxID=220873 RepID=A0ABQ9ERE0_TEGGR|nr:hypothetical protein KUTeg_014675 [Tegillarca granosa]
MTESMPSSRDGRPNVVPSLGTTHTLLMREHNRIAKILSRINPHWDDETIYQEVRKIISAVLQHITYNEYLPLILGDYYMDKFGLRSKKSGYNEVYNQNVDPGTSNAFGAAAFRFGHSQIPKIQGFLRYETRQRLDVLLEETFHRPKFIQADDGRGILERGVHDMLFLKDHVSLDLGAINIQRGRDHGIPSYNKWRKWCHLPVAQNFYNHYTGLVDHTRHSARLLRKAYR